MINDKSGAHNINNSDQAKGHDMANDNDNSDGNGKSALSISSDQENAINPADCAQPNKVVMYSIQGQVPI
jgi:hypothetical protein